MKERQYSPIGIFDSGIGGVSTLGQGVHMLPDEEFVYFGDNGNGPYSLKTEEQVKQYCLHACKFLIEKGVKAIVVACNTATAISISDLRKKYDLPILGMEPAFKVAANFNLPGKIVVMGTGMTLKSNMLANLIERFDNGAEIVKLPCRDVIIMIETGVIEGNKIEACIAGYFKELDPKEISSVVFGCTHFGILEKQIKNVLGDHVRIADGNEGTIQHLTNILKDSNLLNPGDRPKADILFHNSGNDTSLENSITIFNAHLKNLENN
ncbi:MAG: glutamate racemase [Deltaproteobacteria bacterium]|nr:glutamate racemase [Deltaproteobacteria bacterium]